MLIGGVGMPQIRDLTDTVFGLLRAVERTAQRENGYFVWRCQCECGREILVSTKKLLRGTVSDCGCVKKNTARNGQIAENLTGRRFGEWEVLCRAENRGNRVMWNCRCSCGTKRKISAHDLKAGKTNSCSNPIHERLYNRKKLKGQTFGKLTALYPTEKRDRKGSIYWCCQCECGNIKEVTADALIYGHLKSCGCLKAKAQKNIPNTLHRIDGTCVEILEKRKYRKDNTSGFRGVYKTPKGSWRVTIGFKRRSYYVGTFDSFEAAVKARMEIECLVHEGFVEAYYAWWEKASSKTLWAEQHPLVFDVEKVDGVFRVVSNKEELRKEICTDTKRTDTGENMAFPSNR